MGDMSQRKVQQYLVVIFFLVLVVAYVYLVKPISQKAAAAENNVITQQEIYNTMQAKAAQIAQIPDTDRIQLEAVRRQVPEQPYTETILRDLRRLEVVSQAQLKHYNITVGNTSVQNSTDGAAQPASGAANANVIPIRIETSFTGMYAQIEKLFAELEGLDRLIQVDKMTFNVKQGPIVRINNSEELIISNLTLIAYYSPTMQALLKIPYSIDYTNPDGRINPFN